MLVIDAGKGRDMVLQLGGGGDGASWHEELAWSYEVRLSPGGHAACPSAVSLRCHCGTEP